MASLEELFGLLEDAASAETSADGARSDTSKKSYIRYDPSSGERYAGVQKSSYRYQWPNRKPKSPASKPSAAVGGSAETPGVSRGRLYVRYDPSSAERVEVYQDDPRYASWPNRKPSLRGTPASAGQYVKRRVLHAAELATLAGLKSLSKSAAVAQAIEAAAPFIGVAAAVIVAGVAGYAFGNLALEGTAGLQDRSEAIQEQLNIQLLQAKRALREELGREPTSQEWAALYSAWRAHSAEAFATQVTGTRRPGAE